MSGEIVEGEQTAAEPTPISASSEAALSDEAAWTNGRVNHSKV